MATWRYKDDLFRTVPFDFNKHGSDQGIEEWSIRHNLTPVRKDPAKDYPHLVYHTRWNKCYWLSYSGYHGRGFKLKAWITDVYSKKQCVCCAKDLELVVKEDNVVKTFSELREGDYLFAVHNNSILPEIVRYTLSKVDRSDSYIVLEGKEKEGFAYWNYLVNTENGNSTQSIASFTDSMLFTNRRKAIKYLEGIVDRFKIVIERELQYLNNEN